MKVVYAHNIYPQMAPKVIHQLCDHRQMIEKLYDCIAYR